MTLSPVAERVGVVFEAPAADGIGRIVIDRPDDEVNALDAGLIDALAAAIRSARAHDGLRGLILTSAKPEQWVAGADLKVVIRARDAAELEAASRRLQAVCDELAWLPSTTVAAISGPALGGGLELALACDYRIASDEPSVSLGQPEVNLGLIPAGGGTQRLPRLIGLQRALDLILSGRRLNGRRARRAGILDEVVHPTVLDQAARVWAARPKRPLDRPLKFRLTVDAAIDLAELTPAGRQVMYRRARKAILSRTKNHYPAPVKALEAIEAGMEHGLARGLEVETRSFGELALSDTARHLIWLFLASQRQRRSSRAPARVGNGSGIVEADTASVQSRPAHHQQVAVVGAGLMGAAIAEVAATAGASVRIRDVQPKAVLGGLSAIRRDVDANVARRRLDARQGQAIMQRVSGTTDYSGFARVDVVIEAVFEDLAVKRAVVKELEAVVGRRTVIASNTSALPISHIASQAEHADRIVGMHFFSPAQRMPLLEVVRPAAAAEWAVTTAVQLGARMDKTVIVVGDTPGFYTSRVLGVMLNEAAVLLGEGALMTDIDRAMTSFGFPVGPFVLYDEVGLEVALHAGETVVAAFGDRLPAPSLVPRLVANGYTGRKSGAGFYLWPTASSLPGPLRRLVPRPKRVPNPALAPMLGQATRSRPFSVTEIQDRLALLFVNEAVRCLEEGVLASATDGDLGAVLGLGFPPFLGGPFHFADALGLPTLERRLRALAEIHGRRYEPGALLVERAREGRTFFSDSDSE